MSCLARTLCRLTAIVALLAALLSLGPFAMPRFAPETVAIAAMEQPEPAGQDLTDSADRAGETADHDADPHPHPDAVPVETLALAPRPLRGSVFAAADRKFASAVFGFDRPPNPLPRALRGRDMG
ncbi:hypothetical protein GCM10011390_44430 [Aureimonas endophytica]|uniref:Uncharacterized protein n=1 Tax=Aureimonas endophytica TaxID=2027858 RepID=A0A917A0V3_9HYPH|nr:hypothetical protein [Aureimonas endophytica]GGE20290.1 hypothetical protein GCM10011390_44430 [Aureimonas endophytica]